MSEAASSEDIAKALLAMRQLIFKAVLASAFVGGEKEKADSAWKDFEDADKAFQQRVNAIKPGSI